jgi:hypothetical protein
LRPPVDPTTNGKSQKRHPGVTAHTTIAYGILQAMEAGTEEATAARSAELATAARSGDLDAVQRLSDPIFWDRAGREDWTELLAVTQGAVELGVLGRRGLLQLPPGSVIETLWADRQGVLLLDDQRQFTLLDRAGLLASGDEERIDRMSTKLRAEDAALRYVDALLARDEVAAGAFYEPAFAVRADLDLHERLPFLRSAELIGSVGPRTLVRVELEGGEQTIEYLWREHDGALAIVGARVFRPAAG